MQRMASFSSRIVSVLFGILIGFQQCGIFTVDANVTTTCTSLGALPSHAPIYVPLSQAVSANDDMYIAASITTKHRSSSLLAEYDYFNEYAPLISLAGEVDSKTKICALAMILTPMFINSIT